MGAICESRGWIRAVVIWEVYVGYVCCTHGNIIKHQHVSHMAYMNGIWLLGVIRVAKAYVKAIWLPCL
jgi:hypothetical protein